MLMVVTFLLASFLVSPANRRVVSPNLTSGIESFKIPSESGAEIAAWLMPCMNAKATVLLLHPNRKDRSVMLKRADLLCNAGYASLMIDFQGHGESPGEIITAGYRERFDVLAAIKFIRQRFPEQKIAVIGCSLGGAATLMAEPKGIDVLVLESVYPTITEAINNRLSMYVGPLRHILGPALFLQFQMRLGISPSQLRPIDHLATIGCPVLIASGDCDRHTTLSETRRMFGAARSPKQLLVFEGAKHQDLLSYDPDKYQQVIEFLDANLSPSSTRKSESR